MSASLKNDGGKAGFSTACFKTWKVNNKVYGDTIRKWIGVPVFVAARSLGWHDTDFSEIKEIIC